MHPPPKWILQLKSEINCRLLQSARTSNNSVRLWQAGHMATYQVASHQSCNKPKPIICETNSKHLPCLIEKMQLMQAARYLYLSYEESVLQTIYQEQKERVGTQVWSIRSYLGSNLSGQFSINCTNLHRRHCYLIALSSFPNIIHFVYLLFSCISMCSFRCCLQCTANSTMTKRNCGVEWDGLTQSRLLRL